MRTTPKIEEFKKWAKAHNELAHSVAKAQAFAIVERQRVDAYVLPIFKKYNFKMGAIARENAGKPIESPDDLYLCGDEEMTTRYFAECDKAHRERGFDGPEGQCPALVADSLRRQAERALVEEGCKLFGIESSGLTSYPDGGTYGKLLKLLMGACLIDGKGK